MPRPRRHAATPFDHGDPISRIEPAPLAGVAMLACLLVALSYPGNTNALVLDLPPPYMADLPPLERSQPLVVHAITMAQDSVILWDGEPVGLIALVERLQETQARRVAPGITFAADDRAPYGHVVQVLNLLQASGVTDWRFCLKDLARHQRYEAPKSPTTAPGPSPDEICRQTMELPGQLIDY